MKRDEIFQSKFLKAADLNGKPRTVTVERAPFETLKNPEGKEQGKTVLYFFGSKKALPLNMVNWDSVADIWRRHRRVARAPHRDLPHHDNTGD
jgi:hypothetical protein